MAMMASPWRPCRFKSKLLIQINPSNTTYTILISTYSSLNGRVRAERCYRFWRRVKRIFIRRWREYRMHADVLKKMRTSTATLRLTLRRANISKRSLITQTGSTLHRRGIVTRAKPYTKKSKGLSSTLCGALLLRQLVALSFRGQSRSSISAAMESLRHTCGRRC